MRSEFSGRVRLNGAVRHLIGLVLCAAVSIGVTAPAVAETGQKALVLGSSVSGGASSAEATNAIGNGFTVNVVSDATWAGMTAAQFADYQLIVVGDPHCRSLPRVVSQNATALADAVMARAGGNTKVGNRMLIGTDPRFHFFGKGEKLIETGIDFVGVQDGATNLYLTFTCGDPSYSGGPKGDGEEFLLPKLTIDPAPNWSQNQGPPCTGQASLISNVDQFATLQSAHLQNWFCSAHETFPTFPTDWTALAVSTDSPTKPTCGTDIDTKATVCGESHILISGRGIVVEAPNLELDPPEADNPVGTTHTVTATVATNAGAPRSGVLVSFLVTGANAGASGTCVPADCTTGEDGKVTFTYTGTQAGEDTINAAITVDGARQTATAAKTWIASAPPKVSVSDAEPVVEGDVGFTPAVFKISLDKPASGAVTVGYATADGSATAPADYSAVPGGSVTFASGEQTKTVSVLVNGDLIDEPDHTFTVKLTSASGATIADGEGVGTILDDDDSRISIDDTSVTEGDSGAVDATFTVSLSTPSDSPVTVTAATGDGSAVAPGDYASKSAAVSFAPGETSKPFTVAVKGDLVDELDEQYTVELSDPTNAGIADGDGVGTILDDDDAKLSIDDVTVTEGDSGTVDATFAVSLSAPSDRPVSVMAATADDTATEPGDYAAKSATVSFAPGETSKPFTVAVNGDLIDELDERFLVKLGDAENAGIADGEGVGTILDDDDAEVSIDDVTVTEGDSGTVDATFTVSLSTPSDRPVSVTAATADDTATAPGDYAAKSATVSFAPGDTSQPVTIEVNGDLVDELDERFLVKLGDANNATVADGEGVGTILDDDEAKVSVDDVSVTEGDSGTVDATFTVSLSTPSDRPVSVTAATADGSAGEPADYVATSGAVAFAPGDVAEPFAVPVKGDLIDEPNEQFAVNLGKAVNAEIADGAGVGTIIDDDRNGTFSCRATAVRIGSSELITANPPDAPCKDDSHALLRATASLFGSPGVLSAGVLNASTDQTPNDLVGTKPTASDRASAHADAASVRLMVGMTPVTVEVLSADAKADCSARDHALAGSSRVVGLRIGMAPAITASQPMSIPIGLATLHLNHRTIDKGKVTQRALWLSSSSLPSVVVGEAVANVEGNPCIV